MYANILLFSIFWSLIFVSIAASRQSKLFGILFLIIGVMPFIFLFILWIYDEHCYDKAEKIKPCKKCKFYKRPNCYLTEIGHGTETYQFDTSSSGRYNYTILETIDNIDKCPKGKF